MFTIVLIVIGLSTQPNTPPQVAVTTFPVKADVCSHWAKELSDSSTRDIQVKAYCVPRG